MEQNQQSFLDIYETVISVHSSITDLLLAHLVLTPLLYSEWNWVPIVVLSDGQFFNFKKSEFSHQVALVGKDGFIHKPLL